MFRGGSNTVEMFMSTSSTTTFFITTDNSVGVSLTAGATSWAAYSDERMKAMNEFLPFESALDKIISLRAGTGRYLTDPEGTSRSFLIAQDVQAVLPQAVSVDDNGMLTLRYQEVIPLLVAADKDIASKLAAFDIQIQAIPVFEDQTLYEKIAAFLTGIAERGEAIVNFVTAHKVQTQELCIGEDGDQVCVNKTQLQQILSGQQVQQGGGSSGGNDAPAPEPEDNGGEISDEGADEPADTGGEEQPADEESVDGTDTPAPEGGGESAPAPEGEGDSAPAPEDDSGSNETTP
jgi:hypothetical protein